MTDPVGAWTNESARWIPLRENGPITALVVSRVSGTCAKTAYQVSWPLHVPNMSKSQLRVHTYFIRTVMAYRQDNQKIIDDSFIGPSNQRSLRREKIQCTIIVQMPTYKMKSIIPRLENVYKRQS